MNEISPFFRQAVLAVSSELARAGIRPAGPPTTIYRVGPGSAEPAGYRTRVTFPLA